MENQLGEKLTRTNPVEIGKGVYWVGFYEDFTGINCNPYLITEGEESVLIDGGSRPDFPSVMMKILKTGISPENIKSLIYQHYDPDLCGSIPHLEHIIDSENLKIISNAENMMFIKHYGGRSETVSLKELNYKYRFSSGRTLEFFNTPYAHSEGSFVTFDTQTKILFTSDLFGSYSKKQNFYLDVPEKCFDCKNRTEVCSETKDKCFLKDIEMFHKKVMTSERSLRYALEVISSIPFDIIAPQHGSIIKDFKSAVLVIKTLKELKDVGIDASLKGLFYKDIGDISPILKRAGEEST
ncbi:MAG: MBL fold metallo-hydrolase [Thermodesulfobacteriota bacterium]